MCYLCQSWSILEHPGGGLEMSESYRIVLNLFKTIVAKPRQLYDASESWCNLKTVRGGLRPSGYA